MPQGKAKRFGDESCSVHSARIKVTRLDGGVADFRLTGPITPEVVYRFQDWVVPLMESIRSGVVLLDRAILLIGHDDIARGRFEASPFFRHVPCAMVGVREQLPILDAYSRASSARGVTRAVFLVEELAHAREWALRRARHPERFGARL